MAVRPQWSVSTGSTVSRFDDDRQDITSITVPLRLQWHGPHASASGTVRNQEHTGRNRGGPGAATQFHVSTSGFTVGGSADYQRDAATIDLVFREAPGSQTLVHGARVEREHAGGFLAHLLETTELPGLAQYIAGATTNLSPWRLQVRGDATRKSGGRSDAAVERPVDAHGLDPGSPPPDARNARGTNNP